MTDCVVSGNTAGGNGGGVWKIVGSLTATNSTIANNTAGGNGGGMFLNLDSGNTLTGCTVSGNTAVSGGGLRILGGTLTNCTVSDNTASNSGGGLLIGGAATIGNTIVSGNTAPMNNDIGGSSIATDLGHNLFGAALSATTSGPGNVYTDTPGLASLADNGGPTETMALLPSSPAIDAGSNALIAIDPATGLPYTTDQRGVPFARVAGGTVDIGAYEAQALNLVVDTTADENDGNYAPGDLSLREAVEAANAIPGARHHHLLQPVQHAADHHPDRRPAHPDRRGHHHDQRSRCEPAVGQRQQREPGVRHQRRQIGGAVGPDAYRRSK